MWVWYLLDELPLQVALKGVHYKCTKSVTFNLMTTKVIGIKKFRQNMTSLWKEAKKKNIRFIVLHHSQPVFEVKPLSEEELILEKHAADIAEAREQFKKGEVYTEEEVGKILGFSDD